MGHTYPKSKTSFSKYPSEYKSVCLEQDPPFASDGSSQGYFFIFFGLLCGYGRSPSYVAKPISIILIKQPFYLFIITLSHLISLWTTPIWCNFSNALNILYAIWCIYPKVGSSLLLIRWNRSTPSKSSIIITFWLLEK